MRKVLFFNNQIVGGGIAPVEDDFFALGESRRGDKLKVENRFEVVALGIANKFSREDEIDLSARINWFFREAKRKTFTPTEAEEKIIFISAFHLNEKIPN